MRIAGHHLCPRWGCLPAGASSVKISIGYLYPDLMSSCGDRGNIETVRRRCAWRDIGAEVTELTIGDQLPSGLDLIMIGGGSEARQRLIAADLYAVKGAAIRDAVSGGAAALAVGGGFELLGRFCQPERGSELPGVQLFDCWTVRSASTAPAAPAGSRAGGNRLAGSRPDRESGADRFVGELVVRWGDQLLVGFENHAGGTYLGASAVPLAEVVTGYGNNGSGTEGVISGGAVGTNLRGPCLPRNPALADFLITAALARRHHGVELTPLADQIEQAARTVAMTSAQHVIRRRRRSRPASRPGLVPAQRRGGRAPGPLRRHSGARR